MLFSLSATQLFRPSPASPTVPHNSHGFPDELRLWGLHGPETDSGSLKEQGKKREDGKG